MLLCISTVRTALAGLNKIETAQRKTPKGGQKERTHREDHGNSAGSVKNFRAPAMLKTTPLDCEIKGNLREKRRDPWFGANAPPKAVADPEPVVKTRMRFAGVSRPGWQAGGATTSRSELKSLTQNPRDEIRRTALLRGR